MKKRTKILQLLFISFLAMSSTPPEKGHLIFLQYADFIKDSKQATLSRIADHPTKPEEKVASKQYCLDYEIIKTIELTASSTDSLKMAVLEEKNYVIGAQKNCPTLSKYALTFAKKKNQSFTLIFSPSPCEKVIVNCSKKDFKTAYFDLKEKSEILTLIEKAMVE